MPLLPGDRYPPSTGGLVLFLNARLWTAKITFSSAGAEYQVRGALRRSYQYEAWKLSLSVPYCSWPTLAWALSGLGRYAAQPALCTKEPMRG